MNAKDLRYFRLRYFKRRLFPMLACVLIPLLILSFIISMIVSDNLKKSIEGNSFNMLTQTKDSIEIIMDEVRALTISVESNMNVCNTLRRVIQQEHYRYAAEEIREIKSMILIPTVVGRKYIDSIYIYFDNNYDRFIASIEGIKQLSSYWDLDWLDEFAINRNTDKDIWSVARSYQKADYDSRTFNVVSMMKKLGNDGVIVLNLVQDFFNNSLSSLNYYDGQKLYVLNENGLILFENASESKYSVEMLQEALTLEISPVVINGLHISIMHSDAMKWDYISIIPMTTFNTVIRQLNIIIYGLSVIMGVICVFAAYRSVSYSYANLTQLTALLDTAEQTEQLPSFPAKLTDEYGQLTQKIIKSYLHKSLLEKRLSEKEREMEQLEIRSLLSQISPHFLCNTLQSVFWMSFKHTGGYNSVSRMIENITTILNYALNNNDKMVPIDLEIEHLRYYIDIQLTRRNYDFCCNIDVSPGISHFLIPRLLLQPLVENSISHGFKGKLVDCWKLRIRIRDIGDEISVCITDNGNGIQQKMLGEIQSRIQSDWDGGSIGLFNCNRRLLLSFGEKHTLNIRSKLNLGTSIRFTMPKKH
jgi:two-component system sensor histidine kinase YesM